MTASTLTRALDAIEHLTDPAPPWRDILETGSKLVGGERAVFMTFDGQGAVSMESLNLEDGAFSDYTQHYHAQDIGLQTAMTCPSGTWIDSQELLTPKALSASPYYTDFMCKHRMHQILCHIVRIGPTMRAGLSFQRDWVDAKAVERLHEADIRAYTRALLDRLRMRGQDVQRRRLGMDSVFDELDEAFLLVSRDGAVCHASPGAAAMLEDEHSTLRCRHGHLWHPVERVRALLRAALHRSSLGGAKQSFVLGASDEKSRGSALLQLTRAGAHLRLGAEALVLVRVSRPTLNPSLDLLCAQMQITASEARILKALVDGRTPQEIADDGAISTNTVRKQISMLLEKTGCTRMVDLVRLGLSARSRH